MTLNDDWRATDITIMRSSSNSKRVNSPLSLQTRKLQWVENLLLLFVACIARQFLSLPAPSSIPSIAFRQRNHLSASRQRKLPRTLIHFRTSSIPLPFRHHRSGLEFPDPTCRWAIGARQLLAPVLLVSLSWPLPLDTRAPPSFEVP